MKHIVRKLLIAWFFGNMLLVSTIPAKAASDIMPNTTSVPLGSGIIYHEDRSLFVGDGEYGKRTIFFITLDRLKTSNIYYKTLGFTISRCVVGAQTPHSSGEYIKVVLGANYFPFQLFDRGGYVETHFALSEEYVMSQIASQYPEWYAELGNTDETNFLKFDSIMITINNGVHSGRIMNDNTYYNIVYDIGTPGGTPWNPALKTAYAWADPNKINTHFDKYLLYSSGKASLEPTEPPLDVSGEYVKTIGKERPDQVTWNESSLFDIGKGIPTSEEIKNSIEVDSWFGYVDIGKRQAEKTYRVPYRGSYQESFEWVDLLGVTHKTTYTKYVSGFKSVTRKASYYYIMRANLYDFVSAIVTNSVYPSDNIGYRGKSGSVIFDISINGVKNPTTYQKQWYADNKQHIKWAPYEGNTLQISGSNESDIHNKATGMAEDLIGYPTVKNDLVKIDGQVYMDDREVSLKHAEPIPFKEVANDAFGPEVYQKTVEIPFDVANGSYPTTLKTTYERRVVLDNESRTFEVTKNHIKHGYEQNEPVLVHTPVISPVTILNPEIQTQLIKENSANVRYQLLLDGTYTFKFDPAMHNEIKGYGWSGDPSKFDKYVKYKQVKFPFEVKIDEVFYAPNEWITLKSKQENTFYIPTFAMEGDYYEIDYRVAAENVFDENGVDHTLDTEEIANLHPDAYVAIYKIPIQLSGRIYDFQAVGVYDRNTFGGVQENGKGWQDQNYAFCPQKEEKRSGVLNRLGGSAVRYTLDSTITNNWSERNILPFANGRSWEYTDMGTLVKGTNFSFSLKTMANLWSQKEDEIVITPTFRYVAKDGTVTENINVYYHSENDLFVKYGTKQDTDYLDKVTLKAKQFKDAYREEEVHYTVDKYKEWTGDMLDETAYIRRETQSFCLSKILLSANLRLLTGREEQLEENISLEPTNISKLPVNDELYDRFRYSMQTWYGNYFIPSDLFVTDADVDLWKYANEEVYGLSETDPIFKRDGYVILNFDIKTKNEGKWHLQYDGGTNDMWRTEGAATTATIGDPTVGDNVDIPLRSGDVAIINLGESMSDRYSPAIFMIN